MTATPDAFLTDHIQLTRRHLLGLGAAGAAAWAMSPLSAAEPDRDAVLQAAIDKLETWLTPADKFRDVSRGKPVPHSLPEEKRQEVGLTRETWRLEVISDPDNPARLRKPLTKADGTALDFAGLMALAEQHAVRFAKVMTCLNIGCPLGTGVWEGVPLREVLWLTQPRENLRRVFYHGFHNDDPAQMFRSSLPVGRVLEDPFDLPPVILCYKLNGEWLTPERGGPVRIVVPEAYGFKSIKWLQTVVLSNIAHANDTYAEKNNDVDSPLKTFAATLNVPTEVKPDMPFAVTGYAQVGISGLSKVQVWLQDDATAVDAEDRYFTDAPWVDAAILSPPAKWGGELPMPLHQFDPATGQPKSWPLRLTKVHWAVLLPGVPAGKYTLRCRTIDEHGHAQPKPRPFQKSGHAAIEQVAIRVG
ncbi:MAG TPA: molybdopterin-dependent oxidoreductase [Planctomycetaceae bacterium]|nr:molybdopterin-dependent oxidoreductase [Planctomycetaceae bacterium]